MLASRTHVGARRLSAYVAHRPHANHRSRWPLGRFCAAWALTTAITHHARIAHANRCSSPQPVCCSTPSCRSWRARAARCALRGMGADDCHHISRSHRVYTSVLVVSGGTLLNALTPLMACTCRSLRVQRTSRWRFGQRAKQSRSNNAREVRRPRVHM